MQTYRIIHKTDDLRYFALAENPQDAIALVVKIVDRGGIAAWTAEEDMPICGLSEGVVLDRGGFSIA